MDLKKHHHMHVAVIQWMRQGWSFTGRCSTKTTSTFLCWYKYYNCICICICLVQIPRQHQHSSNTTNVFVFVFAQHKYQDNINIPLLISFDNNIGKQF